MNIDDLKRNWHKLLEKKPTLRIRNAADELGVSEVELLATKIGAGVTRLNNEPKEMLKDLKPLKKVMALTRNENCVHERKGIYKNHKFSEEHPMGVFITKDIDLRIFFNHWHSAFAVVEETKRGTRRSIQFFSKHGEAIHKVYLTKDSVVDAFTDFVNKYTSSNQQAGETVEINIEEKTTSNVKNIDKKAFHTAWKNIKDAHEFHGMFKKFGLTRTEALKLAPSEYYAKKVDKEVIVKLLEAVSKRKIDIMVFAGNKGMIQIHTGLINKTLWHNNWYNIMDPDFNLHLNMDGIANTWIVRKPGDVGDVASLEAYDHKGQTIVQFYGRRRSIKSQSDDWKELISELS